MRTIVFSLLPQVTLSFTQIIPNSQKENVTQKKEQGRKALLL